MLHLLHFFKIENVKIPGALVWAYYTEEMNEIGWNRLHIKTTSAVSNNLDKMYYAGYLVRYKIYEKGDLIRI